MKSILIAAAALALAAPVSFAQFSDDFESYTSAAAGSALQPQGGYFNPVAGSIDFLTYTYAGNTIGVAPHPTGGGSQFIAATRTTNCGRVQHAGNFTGVGLANMTFDVYPTFDTSIGVLPTANNIGSVSLQPSGAAKTFIALMTWANVNTAGTWNADFQYWTAANATAATGTTASTAATLPACFMNLPTNRWYRWSITWDWGTNDIVEITLTDLANGLRMVNRPVGWSLRGGPNNVGAQPNPTDVRFFAGGGTCTNVGAGSGSGNTSAYDNLTLGAGLPAGTLPEYQVNQPGIATGDINGFQGTALCPAVVRTSFAAAATWTVTGSGGVFDLGYYLGPPQPASGGIAITLPDGQIFNLDLLGTTWLCGGILPTGCLSGVFSLGPIPAFPPGTPVITAQVVALGVGPLGVSLSQPFSIVSEP